MANQPADAPRMGQLDLTLRRPRSGRLEGCYTERMVRDAPCGRSSP
jgi:hypothetical protein